MKNILLFIVLSTGFQFAFAEESTPLDPPYQNLLHPQVEAKTVQSDLMEFFFGPKVPVEQNIADQSSVKSQGQRGTCSIFSATALLENKLIQKARTLGQPVIDLDLSEQYLQYIISQATSAAGSYSIKNFYALIQEGQPFESTMTYTLEDWTDLSNPLANFRCGHIVDDAFRLGSCLTSHRDPQLLKQPVEILTNAQSPAPFYDPEFYMAREQARANKTLFFGPKASGSSIWSTLMIKKALDEGRSLTMDISFYYGAWNHRKTEELGIYRDMNLWQQGIITYPEAGSLDRIKSLEHPAGHSVVIVGYDDDRIIEYSVTMEDGSLKTFKRKGVYYFKNSWGNDNFGALTTINNQIYPGYGMITQDYANSYGSFFTLDIN